MGRELAITVDSAEPLACNLCGGIDHCHLFSKRGFELVRCAGCGLAFIANPPRSDEVAGLYSAAADYHGALLDPSDPGFAAMRRIARQHVGMLCRSVRAPRGLRLFAVIVHLPDPLGELRSISLPFKPGGLLLQSTPNIAVVFPRLSYLLAARL